MFVSCIWTILIGCFWAGLIAFFILITLACRYKRLKAVLYDFFSFFKSKIIRRGRLSYSRFSMLKLYVRYVTRYITTLEFIKTPLYRGPRQDRLLRYKLFFVSYGSMFVMFNEIFGHEVYKFSSDTPEPFIIDCGSNIGLAILYFKTIYPSAHIIGFEPCPETFSILQKNVSENQLANVTIYNKALHNKVDKIPFYVSKDNTAIGGWSVKSSISQMHEQHQHDVDAGPLSPYITQPVDLLKMDIEGAETLVLQELATSGKLKLVKQIILEYHHHMVNLQEDNLSLVLKIFEDNGFGYQFNYVEQAVPEKNNRNVLILYVYNKAFIQLKPQSTL